MQVRLKVQRVHAATVAALPGWRERLHQAEVELRKQQNVAVAALIEKKTFCGGFKYSLDTARHILDEYWRFDSPIPKHTRDRLRELEGPVETLGMVVTDLENMAEYTEGKSGFMVWLNTAEYNKIFRHL